MGEELRLFVVAPEGCGDRASVIIAKDQQEARVKALHNSNIHEKAEAGVHIIVRDLTYQFDVLGYTVMIAEKGVFH